MRERSEHQEETTIMTVFYTQQHASKYIKQKTDETMKRNRQTQSHWESSAALSQ